MTVFAFIVVVVVEAICEGFALSVLWRWFVASTFGLPVLSMPQAIGLMLVISVATSRYIDNDQANRKDATDVLVEGLFYPIGLSAITLCIGVVVKAFL